MFLTAKIVQTECNKKKKPKFFSLFIAEVPPVCNKFKHLVSLQLRSTLALAARWHCGEW